MIAPFSVWRPRTSILMLLVCLLAAFIALPSTRAQAHERRLIADTATTAAHNAYGDSQTCTTAVAVVGEDSNGDQSGPRGRSPSSRHRARACDDSLVVAAEAGTAGTRVVIGKVGDLTANGAIAPGERTLLDQLPDLGSPKANWGQNSDVLRGEMGRGVPIRDASIDPATGELINNTGFLKAERYAPRPRLVLRSQDHTVASAGMVSRTATGPERGRLGFASVVSEEFSFLLELGFRLVEASDTLARYESDGRLVRVFHGRGSYELGVEVGRWIEVDGVSREQAFPLRDIVALRGDRSAAGG